jgi:O-antigen/teichoic acid export membrane protein
MSVTTEDVTYTQSYDKAMEKAREEGYEEKVDDIIESINLTFYMVVVALALAGISILVCLRGPKLIILGAVLVASLMPPVYFTFGFPAAVNKDFEDAGISTVQEVSFMGSTTSSSGEGTLEASWGPTWGWFSSGAAASVALIGLLAVRRVEPTSMMTFPS